MPKLPVPTFQPWNMLSRLVKQQPPVQMNNYGTTQERPIITSHSSWSLPLTQQGIVNTDQQLDQSLNQQSSWVPQETKPSWVPQQIKPSWVPQQTKPSWVPEQTQPSWIPQQTKPSWVPEQTQPSLVPQQIQSSFIPQQPIRTFNRVFQPEQIRNRDIQSTSSGYRR